MNAAPRALAENVINDRNDIRQALSRACARREHVVSTFPRLPNRVLLVLVEKQVFAGTDRDRLLATKDLAATGLQKPFIHEFIHRLARLESGVQLNQRVGPQRTRSEATIDKIAQTRLRYRDEARNVAAIIIDDSIAEVEDVHRWK